MDRLVEGYRRFRTEVWPEQRARYEKLADRGQRPGTLVIACSDSRVDPATVFGAGPGEMFVVRNVAGLVPPYQPDANYHGTSAAIEYAVRVLKVARIVVLGHAQCGGIRAMIEGVPPEARDFVETWMGIARPVLDTTPPATVDPEDPYAHYEEEVVRLSLRNLESFPWIQDAIGEGRLALHGCRFGIRNGVLARLGPDGFQPVP